MEEIDIDIVGETAIESADGSEWWAHSIDQGSVIRLHAHMMDEEIAAILIAIARQNQIPTDSDFASTCTALLNEETLILAGGVRIREANKTIRPGCCCGVEDWREQVDAFAGKEHWLGHDPAPWVQVTEEHVILWSDRGIGATTAEAFCIRLTKDRARGISSTVQRDLKGFLDVLHRWAGRTVGADLASKVVARIDKAWEVSTA